MEEFKTILEAQFKRYLNDIRAEVDSKHDKRIKILNLQFAQGQCYAILHVIKAINEYELYCKLAKLFDDTTYELHVGQIENQIYNYKLIKE
jgi:hypothetical protein